MRRVSGPAGSPASRDFFLLWQGQAVSQLGNQAFSVAMAFWTLETTGSASLMGLLLAAMSLPHALLAPVGGAIADRLPRLRVLIACDLVAGGAMTAQALIMMAGGFRPPVLVATLFVVALVSGVVSAFFEPALAAAIPDLVPSERLSAANALNELSSQAAVLVGQGLGGVLYRLLGASRLFFFDGISFFFSAACEALVRLPAAAPEGRRTRGGASGVRQFASEVREGFAYVRRTPGLMAFILSPASFNFFVMPVFVLLPIYVRLYLHAGAEWYGFLLAAISCGSLAGLLLAGALRLTGEARMRFIVALITVAPVPILIVGFVPRPLAALALLFATGVMFGLINVNLLTIIQLTTPAELRGRVLGLVNSLASGLVPLGMALGGFAGDLSGKNVPLVFTACSLLIFATTAATLGRRSSRRFLVHG